VPRRKFYFIFLALALTLPWAGCDRGSHPSNIGGSAPDFTVSDSATTVHLRSYHGKVVVLNFWATWCAPCIEELPTLIALQKRLPGIVVLAISTDEDQSAYQQFLAEHQIDLITVRDAKKNSSAMYGTFRYPETYVIDQKGVVRRKFIGAQDWTSPEILSYLKSL